MSTSFTSEIQKWRRFYGYHKKGGEHFDNSESKDYALPHKQKFRSLHHRLDEDNERFYWTNVQQFPLYYN